MKRNPKRVAIPTNMGFDYIPVDGIVYCRASGNYTQLVFREGQLLITRSLKEMEKHLLAFNFIRIHHSYLINLDHLERYFKGGGGAVEMSNGELLRLDLPPWAAGYLKVPVRVGRNDVR